MKSSIEPHARLKRAPWLVCLVLMLANPTAIAQFQNRFSMPEGVMMTAPREVETLLSDAQEAIDAKQWVEASVALGQLLGIEENAPEGNSGDDYFLSQAERSKDGPKTVLGRVKQILDNLPEEAKQAIELRYGVRAKQLLEQAVESDDRSILYQLSSRFGFTNAGRDASLLLAQQLLTDGNLVEATGILESLLQDPQSRTRFGSNLGVLAVASKLSSGTSAQANKLLQQVREYYANVSIDWNGAKVGWNDKTTNESILKSLQTENFQKLARRIDQPRFEGGTLDRNANTFGGKPIPILRWSVDLHESVQHKENLERTFRKQLSERRSHLVPTRNPISADGLVFVPTYDQRILAIDAKSGKIRWPIVFSGSPLGFSLDRGSNRDSYALGLPAPDYLVRRVWGDFCSSQISTDGTRVFGISSSSAVEVSESFAVGPNARLNRNPMIRTYNVLQAWSIPEEGKLLWECGGVNQSSSEELKGALFLGAPIPFRSELIVLAELNGEVYLISLAPATGQLNWKQPLVANQGTTIALDSQRRSFGLSPSIDGALAICPTLSGYLVAYDLNRRRLAWTKSYPLNPSLMPGAAFNIVGGMDLRETDPMLSRPLDTTAVLHDGVTVFAPSNGIGVYGISNSDGTELWQVAHEERSMFRYVAGIWNQLVVLVYAQEIVGLDLRTGQPAWSAVPIPSGAHVVGKCVRSDSKLLVPLSNQTLLEIDLLQGAISSETRCEKALGNLTVVGNQLLSASPFELTSYSIRDRFQLELLEELKRSPGTAGVLQKEGELALSSGDLETALEKLIRAKQLAPEDLEIRRSLVKASMIAIQTDFDRYFDQVQGFESVTRDLDQSTYLRVLIYGLEKQQRWTQAFEKLLELSDTRVSRRINQIMDGNSIDAGARWSIHEDAWIATQFSRLAQNIPQGDWESLNPKILDRLKLDAKQDPATMRLRLQHFEGLPFTQKARLDYAKSLGNRSMIDAEYLLCAPGIAQPEISDSDEIQRAKATLYLKGERPMKSWLELQRDDAKFLAIAKELSGKNATGSLRYDDPAAMLVRFKEREKSDGRNRSWPQGTVQATSNVELNANGQFQAGYEGSNVCPIGKVEGESFAGWQAYFTSGLLYLVQPKTGEELQYLLETEKQDLSSPPKVHAVNSILIIELKDQLVALDLFHANLSQQDGQLWSTSFAKESVDPQIPGRGRSNLIERNNWGLVVQKKAFRVVDVSRWGVVVQADDELVSIHPLLGTRQWNLQGFRNASIVSKEGALFALDASGSKITKIDHRDGKVVEEIKSQLEGWTPLLSIANRWLLHPSRQSGGDQASRMKLRLVEPATDQVLLSADHTVDTRIAIAGDVGVLALRTDGSMTYWNAAKGTETKLQAEVEGKFSSISAQVFGDIALVMPFASSLELDNVQVSPSAKSDPSIAPCAGRLFAIRLEDGSLVWDKAQRVKHFMFPLNQNRESPAAVFLRRLTQKNARGMPLDFTSIALLDVRTGKLLYQKHDLPAFRGDSFRQTLVPSQNLMMIRLYGNLFRFLWTDQPPDPSSTQESSTELAIGELNLEEFQAAADEMAEKIKNGQLVPGFPLPNNGNLDPPIPR
jgi:outer membrane protein assembly factor BamB